MTPLAGSNNTLQHCFQIIIAESLLTIKKQMIFVTLCLVLKNCWHLQIYHSMTQSPDHLRLAWDPRRLNSIYSPHKFAFSSSELSSGMVANSLVDYLIKPLYLWCWFGNMPLKALEGMSASRSPIIWVSFSGWLKITCNYGCIKISIRPAARSGQGCVKYKWHKNVINKWIKVHASALSHL